MKKNVFIAIFAVLILPRFTNAQGLGSITGRVTDPGGAAVGGAQVTATQEGTGFARSAVTETDGLYVIPSLNPAIYTLTVEAKGFSTAKQIAITLLADQTLTVNVALKLGSTTETVTVLSDALQVDTSTSTLKQVIEERRIADLPLNGRNAAQLTLLVAGAVNSPNGGADQGETKTCPGGVTFSANGSRQNTISYQLDGGNYVDEYTNVNQPFPFPDALQEFSVQTTNYSAEYGSNAGGVVNVITKSGTNKFHGDAFEFNRNPAFNAQNYFATPTPPDRIKRNQFGGTLGGPIIHDKTFVFGGYQRTEFRNPVLGRQNVVGQTDITNFLRAKTAACPTGGPPTTGATGLLDHSFSQTEKLTGRYEFDRFIKAAVFNPLLLISYSDAAFAITAQNFLAHEARLSSPGLVDDFRFSYSRELSHRGPGNNATDVTAFGVSIPFQPKPAGIQGVGVQGGFSFGDNPPACFTRNNYTWADDVSWEIGKHDFHFGGSFERSSVDLNNLFNQPGIFGFATQDNYLFGGASFATYQLFLGGILSDG